MQWRNKADYDLLSPLFNTDRNAQDAIARAEHALALLDAVAADAARAAAATANIRARWP